MDSSAQRGRGSVDNAPEQPKEMSSRSECAPEPSAAERQAAADSGLPGLETQDSCLEELNYLLGDIYSQPPSPEGDFFDRKPHDCEDMYLSVGSPCLDSKQEPESPSFLQVGWECAWCWASVLCEDWQADLSVW